MGFHETIKRRARGDIKKDSQRKHFSFPKSVKKAKVRKISGRRTKIKIKY